MTDRKIAEAAIERLQGELRRRRDEKIARGEVAFVPAVVCGHVDAIERAKASVITGLRAAGETREIVFGTRAPDGQLIEAIVTGVPRPGRDDGIVWPTSIPEHTFTPPAPRSEPQPELEHEFAKPVPVEAVAQGRVIIQIAPPDLTRNDPGTVAIGYFTAFSDGAVEVRNEEDHSIGIGHVGPGGDAAAVARAVMRRKLR
jgi:hypothetical protein